MTHWLRFLSLRSCRLLLAAFAVMSLQCTHNNRYSRQQIEHLVASEIPAGASRGEVLSFLERYKIKHYGYRDYYGGEEPEFNSDLQHPNLAGKAHLVKHYIFAVAPSKSGIIARVDIQLSFFFDGNYSRHFLIQSVASQVD
jgi:hypothetical protein